jgi:predicted transglutaminase-like cysteine proteinase
MTCFPISLAFRRAALLGGACAALIAASVLYARPAHSADRLAYAQVVSETRAPIGWIDFCTETPRECAGGPSAPRDVVLSPKAWRDLVQVNSWVNGAIKPMTDLDHWGVVEKWSYPDDGYGDCEDYVLLKRRMLMQAGWPREALLITVVRDKKDEGHAVLTVKTDKGDYILDNQAENIVLWSDTGYRFVKRQSQSDPNVWVSLGDPRPAAATATAH